MRLPRLSVARLMALILIAALDCVGVGMMLTDLELPTDGMNCVGFGSTKDIYQRRQVAFAVVPMANILALVGIWGRRRPGRTGFLVAGGLAMLAAGSITKALAASPFNEYELRGFQSWSDYFLIQWMGPHLAPIHRAVISTPDSIRRPFGFVYMIFLVSTLPTIAQLGVGLLGWWFDRRYEIRRRP